MNKYVKIPLTNYDDFVLLDPDIAAQLEGKSLFKTQRECVCFDKDTKLHRFVMNFPKNKQVHHINKNIFDNRRSNLAVLTISEHRLIHDKELSEDRQGSDNVMWGKKPANMTHNFKGASKVYIRKDGIQMWSPCVNYKGKTLNRFGIYPDPISAQIIKELIYEELIQLKI